MAIATALGLAFLFIVITFIFRYSIVQQPFEKIKAAWVSAIFTFVAMLLYILINGGELDATGSSIAGFATMILCYNIMVR